MRRGVAMLAGLAAALGAAPAAHAADFTVNNLNSSGAGSLRQAVADSNNGTGPDRVVFQPGVTGTIAVPTYLEINEPLEVLGPSPKDIHLVGTLSQSVFVISTVQGADVTIAGLTISRANPAAISSSGSDLVVRETEILSSSGAGIRANSGSGQDGPHAGADLTVRNSAIWGSGSGIDAFAMDTTITGSTVSGNGSVGVASSGSFVMRSSTVVGNLGTGVATSITYCGTCQPQFGAAPSISNVIIANNGGGDSSDLCCNVADVRFSLIERPPPGTVVPDAVTGSNIIGVDPGLEPLRDNGGLTSTHLPGPTSRAIDQGSAGGFSVDQRGSPRTFDAIQIANSAAAGADGTDIGSVERKLDPPTCNGEPATIYARGGLTIGTPGRDVIVGNEEKNKIRARGGDDLVCAEANKDKLFGGNGRDTLLGGLGKDLLVGGKGKDRLRGGPGKDRQRQ